MTEKIKITKEEAEKARATARKERERVNSEGSAKFLADKAEFLENRKIAPVPKLIPEPVVEDLLGKTSQNLPVNSAVPTKTSQNLDVNFVAEELKLKQTVLSPTEQKKQAFFETLPEEEVSYYEGLSNQGLSTAQLYKIKVAKDSKTIGRKVN